MFEKFLQQENTCVGAFFNKVEGLQVLGTPILKITANGCLVHNMSLKTEPWQRSNLNVYFKIRE